MLAVSNVLNTINSIGPTDPITTLNSTVLYEQVGDLYDPEWTWKELFIKTVNCLLNYPSVLDQF